MSHAIRIHRPGGPEQLRFEPFEPGAPGPGEVLLRQSAIGLNFIDVYYRAGLYPAPSLPFIPGVEGAGVIEAVGPNVEGFAVGDRVAYASGPLGAYAERRLYPAERLIKLPPEIHERQAAAMMLKGMTAEFLLHRCYPVQAGETVVIHAAAGGVGQILCQWARHLGATVIGTVGSEAKAAIAQARGCHHVIRYDYEDVARRVREITGGAGAAVVYDSVGQATFAASLASLRRRGTLVSFGQSSGKVAAIDPIELSRNGSLYLTRPTLADYIATRAELVQSAGALLAMVADGRLTIEIGQEYPLREAAQAHRALEARQTHGSTLLIP